MTRKSDKTGLIAWQGNKYSVPMAYQGGHVSVVEHDGQLQISDLSTGKIVAEHLIRLEKGQVIKNTGNERDKAQRITALQADILQLLGDAKQGNALCDLLKASAPKIYKDQLAGAKQVLTAHCKQHGTVNPQLLIRLLEIPRLTTTSLRDRLQAWHQHPQRQTAPASPPRAPSDTLKDYGALTKRNHCEDKRHAIH